MDSTPTIDIEPLCAGADVGIGPQEGEDFFLRKEKESSQSYSLFW